MIDSKRPAWAVALFVLVFAAPPAAAQPAAWAQNRREPLCIYDGVVAPRGGAALDVARVGTVVAECRQRFGWTEAQGNRGFVVARLMLDMMIARSDALDAGVDAGVLDAVFGTFSDDDILSMGSPGDPVSPRVRQVAEQLARRLAERGLGLEPARKAGQAIMLRMMATHLIAEFASELQVDVNG